ncbi:hypothetical protein ACFVH6_30165 [Spirillospora sp. NPDC127200]
MAGASAVVLAYWGSGGTALRWFTVLEQSPDNTALRGTFLAGGLVSALLCLLPLALGRVGPEKRRVLLGWARLAGILLLIRGGLGLMGFAPRLFEIGEMIDLSSYSRTAVREALELQKIPTPFRVWHLFLGSLWAIIWGLSLRRLGRPQPQTADKG